MHGEVWGDTEIMAQMETSSTSTAAGTYQWLSKEDSSASMPCHMISHPCSMQDLLEKYKKLPNVQQVVDELIAQKVT